MAYLQLATFKGSYGANWATLASDYTAGGTSWVLTAGHGARFPANGVYWARLGNSNGTIKRVTARSTDTLTVDAAAADGTTDQNLAAGGTVDYVLGQAALEQAAEDANRVLTVSAFDALASHEYKNGDQIRLSDSVYTVRRSAGAWVYEAFGQVVTRPPSTGWSWDNQNSSTIDSTNGYEFLDTPKSGTTSITMRYRTPPVTPYTVKFLLQSETSGIPPGSAGTWLNGGVGVGFRESSSAKIIDFYAGKDATSVVQVATRKWTTSTAFSAAYVNNNTSTGNVTLLSMVYRFLRWVAITDDGTNLIYWWSPDGYHWKQYDSQLRGNFFSSAPNGYGVTIYANGGAVQMAVLSVVETASATP